MDEKALRKIQGWFEILNRKFDEGHPDMIRKQQFENRFQALLTAMTNLHKRVQGYKDQQDQDIYLIKLALRQLSRDVEDLQTSPP